MNQSFGNIAGVFERITDAFVALDNNWCITHMNKKAGEIVKRDPEKMIGKQLWTEFPESIETLFGKALKKAMGVQRYVHIEEYYPPYDSWVEADIYPSPEGLSVFVRDITDRKRIEEVLKTSEKQLDLIYNTIHDTVFLISVDKEQRFRFQSVNKSFLSVTGLRQEQVEGKFIEEVIPEPSRSFVLSKYKEAIHTRQIVQWEEISEYPSGKKTGIVKIIPVFNDTNECITLVGTVYDITQIKKMEEKLIKANRLYFFISQINQMIVRAADEATLFKEVCQIAVDIGKFSMAWIGMLNEETKAVIPIMYAGEERGYLSKIKIISINNLPEGQGPTGVAIREERYIVCNDIENDPIMSPWREEALGRGYYSSMAVPIKKFGKIIGTFSIYAPAKNFFDAEEIMLLEEATGNLSFAVENFERESQRKKAEEEILEKNKQLRMLSEYLQKVREEERTHIAREIHDELGQQLTVMKMDVSWLNKILNNADENARQKMEELKSMLDQTVKTVRRISSELRPGILDDMGLIPALEWHLTEFEKRSGVKTEFNKTQKGLLFSDALKTGLYRIVQESLTNVARYAKAKNVTVSLSQKDGQVVLTITDNGVGFGKKTITTKNTLGILGMKERTEMLGGAYTIKSVLGKGTTVTVSVPFDA